MRITNLRSDATGESADRDIAAAAAATHTRNGRQTGVALVNVELIADAADANPALIRRYNIDVRDFVVLACLCQAGPLHSTRLAALTELSPSSTGYCLEALVDSGLVLIAGDGIRYTATQDGRSLVRQSRLHHPEAGESP